MLFKKYDKLFLTLLIISLIIPQITFGQGLESPNNAKRPFYKLTPGKVQGWGFPETSKGVVDPTHMGTPTLGTNTFSPMTHGYPTSFTPRPSDPLLYQSSDLVNAKKDLNIILELLTSKEDAKKTAEELDKNFGADSSLKHISTLTRVIRKHLESSK